MNTGPTVDLSRNNSRTKKKRKKKETKIIKFKDFHFFTELVHTNKSAQDDARME
jgi:hypothetical protein